MEWLTLIAILIGPIVALRLQTHLERRKADFERRLKVFKTLMVTRGAILSPDHVAALNSIDIEFNSLPNEDKGVRQAWKAYLDHLGQPSGENASVDDRKRWHEKIEELLADLIHVMSKAVGYDFDKVYIKRTAYSPNYCSDLESEQTFIRRSVVEMFRGKKSLPVQLQPPSTKEGASGS